jgi:hypothetical protein
MYVTIYYLYIKTHNKTGLKYLGKTTAKNPHEYLGSGIDWKIHLKEHGRNFTTEILRECSSNEELAQYGRFYSNLWNVAKSPEWANRIPETGGGPGWKCGDENPSKTEKFRKFRSESQRGDNNPKFDHVEYTFQHKLTGETCKLTQHDFIKMTGAFHSNVADLVNPLGRQKSVKKWIIIR